MEEEAYEEFLRQQTLKSVKTEKRNYGSDEWSEGNRHQRKLVLAEEALSSSLSLSFCLRKQRLFREPFRILFFFTFFILISRLSGSFNTNFMSSVWVWHILSNETLPLNHDSHLTS